MTISLSTNQVVELIGYPDTGQRKLILVPDTAVRFRGGLEVGGPRVEFQA